MKKYAYIDALRGLAVLGVILVHCGQRADISPWLKSITDQGARGVQLFFILSALTLFLSLKKRTQAGKTEEKKYFFLRRFFRIAPMFYLAAIFYTGLDLLLDKFGIEESAAGFDLANFASTFLFFTNEFQVGWINKVVPGGWSITVEMTFYLLVPFLFTRIKSLKSSTILFIVTAIAGALITSGMGNVISSKDYLFYWFPNQISIFMLGIVVFYLTEGGMKFISSKTQTITTSYLMVAAMAALAFVGMPNQINHVIYGLTFAILISMLSRYELKVFVNPILRYIGKLSFSLYLTHFFVLRMLDFLISKVGNIPGWIELILLFIGTLIIASAASYLTHRFIEEPGQKLGNKLITSMKNRRSNAAYSQKGTRAI